MLDQVRSDFRRRNRTTMLVFGLSTTVLGGLTATGVGDVGVGPVLGTVVLVCGLLVLGATVAWGDDEPTEVDS